MLQWPLDAGKWNLDVGNQVIPWQLEVPNPVNQSLRMEVGVRPNDIIFDDASPIRGTVRHSVFLGSEYDDFVQLGSKEFLVRFRA